MMISYAISAIELKKSAISRYVSTIAALKHKTKGSVKVFHGTKKSYLQFYESYLVDRR
jgi:hypothetical protein